MTTNRSFRVYLKRNNSEVDGIVSKEGLITFYPGINGRWKRQNLGKKKKVEYGFFFFSLLTISHFSRTTKNVFEY